jgi:hypothetical protein
MARKPTMDQMIDAIQEKVCIRKIWLCKGGWGTFFVLGADQRAEHGISETNFDEYRRNGTVFAYYDSLEDCVRAEYDVWALGKERPRRG